MAPSRAKLNPSGTASPSPAIGKPSCRNNPRFKTLDDSRAIGRLRAFIFVTGTLSEPVEGNLLRPTSFTTFSSSCPMLQVWGQEVWVQDWRHRGLTGILIFDINNRKL